MGIEDHDVVTAEGASSQKGMKYRVGKKYSVFLISSRKGARMRLMIRSHGCCRGP